MTERIFDMAIIRVNKTRDYTVMSNYHFREREMSLKAKGLLSLMLALPDDWDYSVGGLVAICKENETAIESALKELKAFGYLEVTKKMPNETKSGRYEYIYDVYEQPRGRETERSEKQGGEKQGVENLGVEFLGVENQGVENRGLYKVLNNQVLNNQVLNDKVLKREREDAPSADAPATPARQKFGQYKNVLLSEKEADKLKKEFPDRWESLIEELSGYMESTGKPYKNHLATLRRWAKNGVENHAANRNNNPALNYAQRPSDELNYDGYFINLEEYGKEHRGFV